MTQQNQNIRSSDDDAVKTLGQSILQETVRQAGILASLSNEVHSISEQVASMSRLMRGDGDGEQGIIWRMKMLEQSSKVAAETIKEVKSSLDIRAVEDQRGRWGLTQNVIVALIAMAAAITGGIINFVLNRHEPVGK